MRNWVAFLVLFLIFSACKNASDTKYVVGRYINKFESDADHFVELKADSSFLHVYKKNGHPKKANEGRWKLITKSNKAEIMFGPWISFGINSSIDCKGCVRFVKMEDGELIFNVDLPNEMNFKKVEE